MSLEVACEQLGATPASTSRLPAAILAQILQHVPQQQRLQHCALVNSTWAAAAAAATTHVTAAVQSDEQLPALQSWISKFGPQLTTLVIINGRSANGCTRRYLMLPCAELVQLSSLRLDRLWVDLQWPAVSCIGTVGVVSTGGIASVSNCDVAVSNHAAGQNSSEWESSSSNPTAPLPLLLPALQELYLRDCIFGTGADLMCLADATSLTRLNVNVLCLSYRAREQQQQQRKQQGGDREDDVDMTCEQLLGLTLSRLLHKLTQLKWLSLQHLPAAVTAKSLEGTPSSLQTLHVEPKDERLGSGPRIEACLPVRLPQLTGLRQLCVQSGYYYPSVLADLRGLHELHLTDCCVLYGVATAANAAGTATGAPTTLLSALAQLTGLRSLDLQNCANGFSSGDLQRFSALAACGDIQRLAIVQDSSTTSMLPRLAVHHLFPAGRQLSALTAVILETSVILPNYQLPWQVFMGASELRAIVDACPALEHLGYAVPCMKQLVCRSCCACRGAAAGYQLGAWSLMTVQHQSLRS